ncbi:cytochrome c oxidase assembly protein COX16 homolog, mitochondrial isoform X3 [Vidua chalybeata]|uniref:cytochrome c oxidase assembly protein COX16 homolog, mitochondrial isoform X3 n=1 Tax=Vidua chalybeata TaxID=81927 RepID=UPI0023A847BB|nr:cytochrome c oxidase assembly protein COX16 homolog, mitochondrial isoform X3 [Vidua chalybeata]XP_053801719.1 cytochrome c oxidase assembly protein COX16 homolog, mitochondrial isoform X3 [Vidua chalybeata]
MITTNYMARWNLELLTLFDHVSELSKVDPALKEKLKQNTVTLESEYEKLQKLNLDDWENIRGPSLWEDSRMVQKQQREALRLKTE